MSTAHHIPDTSRHQSRVLMGWLSSRDGGMARAAVRQPAAVRALGGDNDVTSGLTAEELVAVLRAGGAASRAGVTVTADNALRVSTVYRCVGLIAGTIAALPVGVFERKDGARAKVDHEYSRLLNVEPGEPGFTAYAAWEYLLSSKLLRGDGFGELVRPSFRSGRVVGIKPHHPDRVQPFLKGGELYYRVTDRNSGTQRVLPEADMLHFHSLGFDGLRSPSPITYAAREAVGVALAAEAYHAGFFAEGATFDYVLSTEATLKKESVQAIRTRLLERETGGANSRSPLIVDGGLKPIPISISGKDAEVLATRTFSVEEICRFYGVPPFMVSQSGSSNWGTGIEQQGIGFVRHTLMNHIVPAAQELNRKLFPQVAGAADYFVEHITAALERGDLKTRYEAYRIALGRAGEPAWMALNEVRRLENLPPVEGGDELTQTATEGKPSAPPNQPPAPAPQPEPPHLPAGQ